MGKYDAIVERLMAEWRDRPDYAPLPPEIAPANIDEAYAAQAELRTAFSDLRGPLAGRKIALAAKAMQEMCGIDHPIAGGIFQRDIRRSPASVRMSEFRHVGLEFELALTLGADAPAADGPYDAASVRPLIAAAQPAFELIEDKAANYAELDVLTIVADNAWCGGVILGPEIDGWRTRDLDDLPARLTAPDGTDAEANTGLASPLKSLAWVLNDANARGETPRKGEVIITGSALRTRFPAAGEAYRYEIAGAEVAVAFT